MATDSPWYADGLSFECTGCGKCCSGPSNGFVWVNDDEIASIAHAMGFGDDTESFTKRFVRRVGLKQSLVEYSDGDCIFLEPETRRCLVYEARPIQCRTWPFWDGNLTTTEDWDETSRFCPGCNRGRVYALDDIELRRQQRPGIGR